MFVVAERCVNIFHQFVFVITRTGAYNRHSVIGIICVFMDELIGLPGLISDPVNITAYQVIVIPNPFYMMTAVCHSWMHPRQQSIFLNQGTHVSENIILI